MANNYIPKETIIADLRRQLEAQRLQYQTIDAKLKNATNNLAVMVQLADLISETLGVIQAHEQAFAKNPGEANSALWQFGKDLAGCGWVGIPALESA